MWVQRLVLNQISIGKNMYTSYKVVLASPLALKRTRVGKYAHRIRTNETVVYDQLKREYYLISE
jgi:hypothetical protein